MRRPIRLARVDSWPTFAPARFPKHYRSGLRLAGSQISQRFHPPRDVRRLHRVSTIVTLTTTVQSTTCSLILHFNLWRQVAINHTLPNVRRLAARMLLPSRCDAKAEGSTNGLRLTTHRERGKYPWIAKARAGTKSPSKKLLKARRVRPVN